MQKSLGFALVFSGCFIGSEVYSQEGGAAFNNFLLRSPSIISPSQNYQVKKGRFEADLGLLNGSVDPKAAGADEVDVKGTELGVAAYYSPSAFYVVGADINYETTEADDLKSNSTEITPAVTLNFTPMFSLGIAAHLVSGSDDIPGGGDEDTSFNYFTVGGTLHEGPWEGSLVFSSENKDDNKPQNNSAQTFGIHGRYRIVPTMALGLSFIQKDTSSLVAGANAKDETALGLHLESQFTDTFAMEFGFISTANTDGADGDDGSEFLALGQFELSPSLEVGGRLSYLTSSSDAYDAEAFRLGVFLTTYF